MLPVAILSGGLATRLRPVTETIPKALVEILGVPFICRQLDNLSTQGFTRVIVCIGYLGEMIEKVVGDGSRFGLEISYSSDGDNLLGTGGALKQALPLLGQHFFVLYGDSYLPVDFAKVERAFFNSGKIAMMTILKNNNNWDTSNVLFEDGQLLEYNKQEPRPDMAYIDYGLGVISNRAFENYENSKAFDLSEVYYELSIKNQLAGFEVNERFYEIGSHKGLKDTEDYFRNKIET